MDRARVKLLRDVLQDGLTGTMREQGLAVEVGRATFSDSNVKFTITLSEVESDGTAITPELQALRDYRVMLGLPENIESQVLNIGGRNITVNGYKPRSRKYPMIGTDVDTGKRYKFSARAVKWASEG